MSYIMAGTAAVGLATSIYGGIKSAKANKEAQANIDNQKNQADAFYNNRVNRDFMETNAAKGIVEQLRKRYQEQAKTIDSHTAATGGTAEANIAAKTASNDSYNEAMNSVAQGATESQDRAEMINLQQNRDIAGQNMQLTQNKGEQATNLMGTGANLIGTGMDVAALNGKSAKVEYPKTIPNKAGLQNIAKTEPGKILVNNNKLGLTDNNQLRTKLKQPSTLAQQLMERKSWE